MTRFLTEDERRKIVCFAVEESRLQTLLKDACRAAIETALVNDTVKQTLADRRSRVVSVDLHWEKLEGSNVGDAKLLGVVGIYDYERDVVVAPAVDLVTGEVVEIGEHKHRQPPVTSEELEEAKALAGERLDVRKVLERSGDVTALPSELSFTPDNERYGHRCWTLSFWSSQGREREPLATAVVDLSTRELVNASRGD